MQTLSERLVWARKTAELTTRQLATAADVAFGYPSAIECRQLKRPSVESLKKLSDALGVTFDWLFWGSGRRPSETALRRRGSELKKEHAA